MRTIKEIADDLNVEKQKVYRFIKKCKIKEVSQNNQVKYYSADDERLIIEYFQNQINQPHQNHINEPHQPHQNHINEPHQVCFSEVVKEKECSKNQGLNHINEPHQNHINEPHQPHQNHIEQLERIIETLKEENGVFKKELDVKNDLISNLSSSVNNLTSALDVANKNLQASQMLHAERVSKENLIESKNEDVQDAQSKELEENKSFLQRLFRL